MLRFPVFVADANSQYQLPIVRLLRKLASHNHRLYWVGYHDTILWHQIPEVFWQNDFQYDPSQ